ncbi:MAG: sigma-70 family RNA polymerase sigma factor [Actinomycetota bacterium]
MTPSSRHHPELVLVQEDDGELISRARAGDDAALVDLLRRYRDLARWLSRSYYLPGSDEEDVAQEAMVGLFKAFRDFDPAVGTPFRAFVTLCIDRQIATAIKNANRIKHRFLDHAISLDAMDESSERGRGYPPLRVVADPSVDIGDLVASADAVERLRADLLDLLTNLEREVLRLYMAGHSYEEMAEVFGSSLKSIDNALQRVKFKMRRHLDHGN